jgi:hypothetical protein
MKLSIKDKIEQLEESLIADSEKLGLVVGDSDMFPLKHTFVDGLYIREMSMAKGTFAIGKLQKHEHLWILLKGKLTITTISGTGDYIGPCYVKANGGEKKAVYAHTDSVFLNVYPNKDNTTDLEEIENLWIAKNYLEYEEFKQIKQ